MARGGELRRRGRLVRNCTSWNPFECVCNFLILLTVDGVLLLAEAYGEGIIDSRTPWLRSALTPGLLSNNARHSCLFPFRSFVMSCAADFTRSCFGTYVMCMSAVLVVSPACSSSSVVPRVTLICSCASVKKFTTMVTCSTTWAWQAFTCVTCRVRLPAFRVFGADCHVRTLVTVAVADEMSAPMLSCNASSQIS